MEKTTVAKCSILSAEHKKIISDYKSQFIKGGYSEEAANNLAHNLAAQDIYDNAPWQSLVKEFGSTSQSTINQSGNHVIMDTTVSSTTMETIFDSLDAYGNVRETVEHSALLKDTLNKLVKPVLNTAQAFTLKISKEGKEAMGKITGKDIDIVTGIDPIFNGIHLSLQEIYSHELIHGISQTALQSSSFLHRKAEKLFQMASKHLTPDDFRARNADGTYRIVNSQTEEIRAAQERYDYIFNTAKNPNAIYEFVAFGLTNKHLIKKLKSIAYREAKQQPTNLYERIQNLLTDIANFIEAKFLGIDKNDSAYDYLFGLTLKLAAYDNKANRYTAGLAKGYDNTNKFIANKISQGIWKASNLQGTSLPTRVVRLSARYISGNPLKNLDSWINDIYYITRNNTSVFANILKDLILDIPKEMSLFTSEAMMKYREVLIHKRNVIDHGRNQIEQATIESVRESFLTGLTEKEDEALFYGILRTDLSTLRDKISIQRIAEIFNYKNAWEKQVTKYEDMLDQFGSNKDDYIKQAKGLAKIMVTESTDTVHQMLNAHNIAQGRYTKNFNPVGDLNKAEEIIDILKTLYAIDLLNADVKKITKKKITDELTANSQFNGISFMLDVHKNFKERSLNNLFKNNKTQTIAGWTFDITDPNIDVAYSDSNNDRDLIKAGYKLMGQTGTDKNGLRGDRYIYVSNSNGLIGYNQGAMSITSNKVKGTTVSDMLDNKANTNRVINQIRNNMFSVNANGVTVDDSYTHMIPVLNDAGSIVNYRYIMNSDSRNSLLKRDTRMSVVFGKMEANVYDKIHSRVNDIAVSKLLKEDYDNNFNKKPTHFVNLATDPEFTEVYALIPKEIKDELTNLFGDSVMVRREAIRTVFGSRKVSVASRISQPEIAKVVNFAERLLKEIIGIVKHNIVIKTDVLMFNIISNTITLMIKGVPIDVAIKGQFKALSDIKDYMRRKHEIVKLKEKIKARMTNLDKANMEKRIALLESRLKEHPSHYMVNTGKFITNIVEDVGLEESTLKYTIGSKVSRYFENTPYLPNVAKQFWGYMYLTKRNPIYQILLDGTRYSDFVARQVLHDHLVKQGVGAKEAIAEARGVFVDYEFPTSRTLQWLNDVGLQAFTKYALRIQMPIYRMFRDNSAGVAALYAAEGLLNINVPDISDSLSYIPDLTTPYHLIDGAPWLAGAEGIGHAVSIIP